MTDVPPRLRPGVTILGSLLLAAVVAGLFFAADDLRGVSHLDQPALLLEQATACSLDVLDALPTLPAWMLPLTRAATPSRDLFLVRAIGEWREFLSHAEHATPEGRAFLGLLLLEAGREEAGRSELAVLDLPGLTMASDWGRERLAGENRAASLERGRRRLRRWAVVEWLQLLVIGGGAAVAVGVWRRRPNLLISDGFTTAPWTFGRGYAVFVRVFALGLGGVFLADFLSPRVDFSLTVYGVGGAAMVLLVRRHLLRPSGRTVPDGLGLRLLPGGRTALGGATLMLAAADLAVVLASNALSAGLGFIAHWTELVDETLVRGTAAAAWTTALVMVVAAPVVEEIAFRGLLFSTLRRRMSTPWAALLSGALFGAIHLYSPPSAVQVAAGGVLYAWAYARTGSLLPAMLAHAVHNTVAAAGIVLLFR